MEKHLSQNGGTETEIETESNYTNLENMLIADMTKYEMAKQRVTSVTAGTSSSTLPSPRTLKKAKADVVESEFMLVDTKKGQFMIPTDTWFEMCLKDICDKSRELGISNPMCYDPDDVFITTPFIVGSDFPKNATDPYEKLVNRSPIGGGG